MYISAKPSDLSTLPQFFIAMHNIMKLFKFFFLFSLLFSYFISASAYTYTVEIGQFEKLKVNGNIRVVYNTLPDSTGYARYEAPLGNDNIFVFSTKADGSLKVQPNDNQWGQKDLPVLYIYSDFISSVESYSDLSIELLNLAPCASLSINLVGNGTIYVENIKSNNVTAAITTGNGSIYLYGVCVNANYRMVGAGLISADQLRAENVKCRILGTGSIGCWPIDNLNVTGLGSTKIYYKGKPNVSKKGGGKLFELPEDINPDSYSKLGTEVKTLSPPEEEIIDIEDENYQTVVTDDE